MARRTPLKDVVKAFVDEAAQIRCGGGDKGVARQHRLGRLTARERIDALMDTGAERCECGLFAAWNMYQEYGGAASAGLVTTIGQIGGKLCMVIANDATVKAGAFFPMTCKKLIRAQMIAQRARLPLVYLVDSAGVFLPLQEDVFPDTDDFGRIFRNNAVFSAEGLTQIAAIMGNCVAGGGYLPVLCDTLLMTEGSGLYLAGPALVKAAIGQGRTTRNSAARRCTQRSPARSTSGRRTTRRASRGCRRCSMRTTRSRRSATRRSRRSRRVASPIRFMTSSTRMPTGNTT
jgi:acetyl-CoA carboxylase carboxyltransferase component